MKPHAHPEPDCEVLADALAPSPAATGSAPPPPPVRLARLLALGDALFTRTDALVERWVPRAGNPLAQLGPATNALLLLATVSGVLMFFWYSPSVQLAWHSLADLGPRSAGGLVRSVHRYASDLAMLALALHALRTLLARKFADARWLAWVSGLAMAGLVWLIGWTGFWLVWDQRAQLLAAGTLKLVDVLPVFGEPMQRLLVSDRTVPSLLFFVVFFLHMVLPLAITGGLALHLARLSRSQLLPDRSVTLGLVAVVLAAAVVFPAANAAPAAMAVKPAAFTMDWWYLWPLALTTRLAGPGLALAAGLLALGAATAPWWLARRRPRAVFQAKVDVSRCFACTQCSQDCPFGAITMVPRTDGKPFPSQAQVDPDRCIGCGVCAGACDTQGVGLAWFDAQQVTRELEALVAAGVAQGRAPALALVCAQGDGGWELFARAAWERRLPAYVVRPVPCAGWVEPKVIERLLAKGARAVLVVGCASGEAFCREGNLWLPARLAGAREPAFRPNRADPLRKAHVDFDPLRPHLLAAAAAKLLATDAPAAVVPAPRSGRLAGGLVALALAVLAVAAVVVPGNAWFHSAEPAHPEFIFTFRAHGAWLDATAAAAPEHDNRPVHMRAAGPAHRSRSPVTVRLAVDGREETHVFRPKGVAGDGAAAGELRVALAPGAHVLAVTLVTSPDPSVAPVEWHATLAARAGRNHVLMYEAQAGFVWEP